ncbi:MAG: hypothetical protein DRN71_05145 [Candidatus Nanohalarchaeota archaeon]|nr:MAG: hypothetical protein DRN71_05145 [Candidatus Nanohaloarchaeota archaeon]
MSSNGNRKIILGVGIIISFALLTLSVSTYFNYQHDVRQESRLDPDAIDEMTIDEIKQLMIESREAQSIFHGFYLLPFMAFIGLLVGTVVYYLMSDKVIQQEQTLKKNTKIILNFLTRQERNVIETLIENNGKVQQYELSHLPNLNKVKTHRILVALEQKGIIRKERLGKINKIVLNDELYDVLKD